MVRNRLLRPSRFARSRQVRMAALVCALLATAVVAVPVTARATGSNAAQNSEADTWDGSADVTWYDASDPQTEYTLYTAEQLAGFGRLISEKTQGFKGVTIKLGANIDLSGHEWMPIGAENDAEDNWRTFYGTFDGQGHAVSNMTIDKSASTVNDCGFFYDLGSSCVQNLRLENIYLNLEEANTWYCGGLAYLAGGSTGSPAVIRNVSVSGTIAAPNGEVVGGFVGCSQYGGVTIEGCSSDVSIQASGSDTGIGGFVGASGFTNSTDMVFEDCVFTGSIEFAGDDSLLGGLVGQAGTTSESRSPVIQNCVVATKDIRSTSSTSEGSSAVAYLGCIASPADAYGTIADCIWPAGDGQIPGALHVNEETGEVTPLNESCGTAVDDFSDKSLVEKLNDGRTGSDVAWAAGVDGYPVLAWQTDQARANYGALDAALEAAPDDLSVYSEASAKAVSDAVEAAKALGDKVTADRQSEIDAAAEAINEAVDNLVGISFLQLGTSWRATYGYESAGTSRVNVENESKVSIRNIQMSFSGGSESVFSFEKNEGADEIWSGFMSTAGFITPKAGLDAGTYTETATITFDTDSTTSPTVSKDVELSFVVDPRSLEISELSVRPKEYDGTTDAVADVKLLNLVEGDRQADVVTESAAFDSADVSLGSDGVPQAQDATVTLTLAEEGDKNYRFDPNGASAQGGNAHVAKAQGVIYPQHLDVAATVADKAYDGSTDVAVTGVTFTHDGEVVSLLEGTDYTTSAALVSPDASDEVSATVSVELTDAATNYTFGEAGADKARVASTAVDASADISQSSTGIGLVTYRGDEATTDFTFGDTITVEATIKATGKASQNANACTLTEPASGTAALYYRDADDNETQLSDPQKVDGASATLTFSYDTADRLVPVTAEGEEATLVVRYEATDNMDGAEATCEVSLAAKELALSAAIDPKPYDGTTDATGTLVVASDALVGDDTATVTGAFAWADTAAGTTTFNVTNIKLDEDAAAWYVCAGELLDQQAEKGIAKAAQEAPTGVSAVDERTAGGNDGALVGLPVGSEWRAAGGTWAAAPESGEVGGLAPGVYEVRMTGDGNHEPSEVVSLEVRSFSAMRGETHHPDDSHEGGDGVAALPVVGDPATFSAAAAASLGVASAVLGVRLRRR